MTQTLQRENWRLGWTPGADLVNGDPNGLVRMDNLRLDELGGLTLVRGIQKVNTTGFEGYVHSIYSKQIGQLKHRFCGLNTGSIIRSTDNFATTDYTVAAGGSDNRAFFSSAVGQIFMATALIRKKYNGTVTNNWGLNTPTSPIDCNVSNQPFLDVALRNGAGAMTNWILEEGSNFVNSADYVQGDADSSTFRTIFSVTGNIDTLAFGGGGTEDDLFKLGVRTGDSEHLISVRIEFYLDSGKTEYYWQEWDNNIDDTEFVQGINAYTTLTCKRSDFKRQGSDNSLDWSTVKAIKVTFLCDSAVLANLVNILVFYGGEQGPLTGEYEYKQINVSDTGAYVAKSGAGPTTKITVIHGAVTLTPDTNNLDSQVTEIWLYRRGGQLENFYRVAVFTLGTSNVTDTTTDEDALELNIVLNQNTISVQDLPDEIFGIIEGLYFDRMVMITNKEILLSESLNPDAIDTSISLHVGGETTEKLLWITKINPRTLLVGSNHNIYQISGTLVLLPDGTIDAIITPLGESHPPLGLDYCLDSGNVLYMANDGWRATNGNVSRLISAPLDLLYRGQTRYGVPPVYIFGEGAVRYPCVMYKSQFVCSNPLTDGSRWLFVQDGNNSGIPHWRPWYTDPICLFTEEDGTLLGGYGGGSGNFLRVLDTGSTIDDATTGQSFYFETVFDSNGQPRNRKDFFTLKLTMDTGNVNVDVEAAIDNGPYRSLGSWKNDGTQDQFIDLFTSIGLGFRVAIRIRGHNMTTFKLFKIAIEYDPRPEQLTQLRIPNTNLGTFSRKRVTNFPIVIDTLGGTVTIKMVIDNVTRSDLQYNIIHDGKKTFIVYFTEEIICTDIGAIIYSQGSYPTNPTPFEFYGLDLSEIISEKLPIPVKYLVIPPNNYGNPNRKRHSSYKFQIDTRGADVRFTPRLDGTTRTAATFNTARKSTVEYFFTQDTIAIDIGGVLETLADTPFEFYGVVIPQEIEVLPARLKEFRIPENNYGIAAKKRIRTMPMEINTNGYDVTFTPIVDGVSGTPTTLNTPTRKTAFHYFSIDSFGVDYSGELTGSEPFEFYGLLKPEDVEVIPVGKLFDQVGPVHLDRVGKVIGFRLRVIAGGTSIPWTLYGEDAVLQTGTLITVADIHDVYEAEWITRNSNAVIKRFVLGPTAAPFHRYYVEFKVNYGGAKSDIKWIRVK